MGQQLATANLAPANANGEADDPLGPVLFQSRTGVGEAIFLVAGGLAAMGLPWAPVWPQSFWTWILWGALVACGAVMLLASPARFARAGTVCSFGERGARLRRRDGTALQELRYEEVEELTFTITRLFMNGVYSGTFQTLSIGSGRAGEARYQMSRTFREETGLVSDYRGCYELEPLCNRIAGLVAERMQAQIQRGQSVAWTTGLHIGAGGVDLPGPGAAHVVWEQIDRIDIDQGIARLWLSGERKPRVEMPTSTPNFFPGYFLLYSLLKKHSTKEQRAGRPATSGTPLNQHRITLSYANHVDDLLAARWHTYQTNPVKWWEWQARAWGLSGLVMIPGIAVPGLLWLHGDMSLGLCLVIAGCSQALGLLLRGVGGRVAWWLERRKLARELEAAHRWSASGNCPDPFVQREVVFSGAGYTIRTAAGTVERGWREAASVTCIDGYLFITLAGSKVRGPELELIVPVRAFGGAVEAWKACETIAGWSRSANAE